MIAPTARAAFGLPARFATSWYVSVFPSGIFLTIFLTLSANVIAGLYQIPREAVKGFSGDDFFLA